MFERSLCPFFPLPPFGSSRDNVDRPPFQTLSEKSGTREAPYSVFLFTPEYILRRISHSVEVYRVCDTRVTVCTMKAYILGALSLVLFAQKSVQEDTPAQKACTALHQKYPELTAYGLDPRYSTANTGMFLLLYLRYGILVANMTGME